MSNISKSAIQILSQIGVSIHTAFFDRDGVINKLLPGQYVKSIPQFELLPNSLEFISKVQMLVQHSFIVTNQQGIGKGIMSHEELEVIHNHLIQQLISTGGKKFDQIFYAPQLAIENSPMRKPNPGMLLKAKELFPEIKFENSILFGDSKADYEMAKKVNMPFIRIENKQAWQPENVPFARSLEACIPYLYSV